MEAWIQTTIYGLLSALALPQVGLSAIFIVSLVSATILPLGSEPAVFAYISLAPEMFWPAVLVGTVGNTLGGIISYFTGVVAEKGYESFKVRYGDEKAQQRRKKVGGRWHQTLEHWANRLGPPVLILSWLPLVGDPLCVVAGWFRLAFWPSVFFMAVGKFLRYTIMTAVLLWIFQADWASAL